MLTWVHGCVGIFFFSVLPFTAMSLPCHYNVTTLSLPCPYNVPAMSIMSLPLLLHSPLPPPTPHYNPPAHTPDHQSPSNIDVQRDVATGSAKIGPFLFGQPRANQCRGQFSIGRECQHYAGHSSHDQSGQTPEIVGSVGKHAPQIQNDHLHANENECGHVVRQHV